MSETTSSPPQRTSAERGDVGEAIDLVKAYVRQETVGPLSGIGRWLAFGLGGAVSLGLGMVLIVLGILRLVQTEVTALDGAWSWVPYTIALVLAALFTVLALSRIKKTSLGKER